MNITIIGVGNVGTGIAKSLSNTSYGVMLAARTSEKARAAADIVNKATGGYVTGADVATAIRDGDVVVLAVPYSSVAGVIDDAGDLSGKIVIDVTNPLSNDFSELTLGFNTSAAEEVQKLIPGIPVVKAYNTVFAQVYEQGPKFGDRTVQVFYAGDDESAKKVVSEIIEASQFEAVDVGPLKNSRYLEPLAALNIQLGYMQGRGTQIAPGWIERKAA